MPEKNIQPKLLKIGQLARMVGVLPSTINFYTNIGLLKESTRSKGGYRLYEERVVKDIEKIQKLQKRRLTIEEIKEVLINGKSINEIFS